MSDPSEPEGPPGSGCGPVGRRRRLGRRGPSFVPPPPAATPGNGAGGPPPPPLHWADAQPGQPGQPAPPPPPPPSGRPTTAPARPGNQPWQYLVLAALVAVVVYYATKG